VVGKTVATPTPHSSALPLRSISKTLLPGALSSWILMEARNHEEEEHDPQRRVVRGYSLIEPHHLRDKLLPLSV
jgi:hypothetical protein